ncbi:MAG: trypsin-like serine protease [Pseudomonadota bacterium]
MMRPRIVLASVMVASAFVLTSCDVVQFPGTGPAPEQTENRIPPPPPTTEVNPIPISEDILDNAVFDDTAETVDIDGSASTPIDDALLAINAIRCGPALEETPTFAEAANAQPAAAVFSPQAVNGTPVTAADFPGIVKLEPKRRIADGISSGHCGATRISENWFVTAAHCLDNVYDQIELIATESSLRSSLAKTVNAVASICHAAYGGAAGEYANDIALIGISEDDAAMLTDVPIARFGDTDSPLTKSAYPEARMAGWGLTSFGGSLSDELLSAELDIVSTGPAIITVASRDSAGPCIGDSGGPLLIEESDGRPTVVGVLSVVEQNRITGEFCSGDYRARYTNVQGYVDWISNIRTRCDASPDLCARAVTTPR